MRNVTGGADALPLELDSNSYLPFASGKDLQYLAKFRSVGVGIRFGRKPIDRRGITAVEQIKELQVGEELGAFSEIEALGNAHIQVNEGRRRKVIATLGKIQAIEVCCPGATTLFR